MSYSDTKAYLNAKPGPLTPEEREYINLKLKGFSTNQLLFKIGELEQVMQTKTDKEEWIQVRRILAQRISCR